MPAAAKKSNEHSRLAAGVASFDAIGREWWDEAGPFKPLHKINPVRLEFICSTLRDALDKEAPRNLRVLDVGCGGGILCEPLARLGARVTGIDASPQAIKTATAHAKQSGLAITYKQMTTDKLKATFDVVCALEVIEHVENPALLIADLARLVRPGGFVFVSTLNRTIKSFLSGIVAAEYVLRWVPKGTHDWDQFIKPSEMVEMLDANGLKTTHLSGMTYDPLNARFELTPRDVGVNYLVAAVKRA